MPHVVWITTGFPSIISGRMVAFGKACVSWDMWKGKIFSSSRAAPTMSGERRKVLAEELVRLKVDVIVTPAREELTPSRR